MTPGDLAPADAALSMLAVEEPGRLLIDNLLDAAREHLSMDVAFAASFEGDEQVFRHVTGTAAGCHLVAGMRAPLGWMYCRAMVDGNLPEAIPDTAANPVTGRMRVTREAAIGSYVGVPVALGDGRVWGTIACIHTSADPEIGKRDVRFLRTLARIYAQQLERDERQAATRREQHQAVSAVLREGRLRTVLQPIVDLVTGEPVGFEALARFDGESPRPPNLWFALAQEVGLGVELELAAVRSALGQLPAMSGAAYLSLNVSPETATTGEFASLVEDTSARDRVVIEVTEHAAILDYPAFNSAVARLRFCGLRYAVDDAGAGFATFSHILSTKPDLVKLDMSLIRDIDRDLSRRALLHGLLYFIEQINATIVAEGVETEEEADALRRLGVPCAQGYYFGRPGEPPRSGAAVGAAVSHATGRVERIRIIRS